MKSHTEVEALASRLTAERANIHAALATYSGQELGTSGLIGNITKTDYQVGMSFLDGAGVVQGVLFPDPNDACAWRTHDLPDPPAPEPAPEAPAATPEAPAEAGEGETSAETEPTAQDVLDSDDPAAGEP